ncbi:MAG TPA: carboxypeptidase-like regulatory domain-containing protein [Longimicrobium sp.]
MPDIPARDASSIQTRRHRGVAETPLASRAAVRSTLAALLIAISARTAGAQVIVGRVLDAQSGAAVQGAGITIATVTQRAAGRTVARDDGRFSIVLFGPGTYRVAATRAGYGTEYSDAVFVGPGDTVRVDLRLQPGAVELAGVTATVRPRRLGTRGKFVPTGIVTPVRAEGLGRRILAQGTFVAPSECYQLAGVADRLRSVVTLYVDARPNGQYCMGGPTAFRYTVTVRGLAAGSYTFRIMHTYRDGSVKPSLALDTALVVPERDPPRR